MQRLRSELGLRYPLAHKQLFVADRELVEIVQGELELETELAIVVRTGQVVLGGGRGSALLELSAPAQGFFDSVEWGEVDGAEIVARLRAPGAGGLVVLDPTRSFGAPTVGGIRTDVIAEEVSAGADEDTVARGFGISGEQVAAAVSFERVA